MPCTRTGYEWDLTKNLRPRGRLSARIEEGDRRWVRRQTSRRRVRVSPMPDEHGLLSFTDLREIAVESRADGSLSNVGEKKQSMR